MRRFVIATAASLLLALLIACSSPTPRNSSHTRMVPTSASTRLARTTVHARLLVPSDFPPAYQMLAPGTLIPSKDLFQVTLGQGQEVFLDHLRGYGLAFIQSQTYPVVTVDGGTSWRVDGPIFYVAAANGPAFVDEISAAAPQTVFVWGQYTGDVVQATTDGGAHWWAAHLGPGVLSMGDSGHDHLWAVVADPTARFFTSTDGGRMWLSSDTIG